MVTILSKILTLITLRSLVRQLASTKESCPDTLNSSRQDLCKAIDQWRSHYCQLFPQAPPHSQADHPENDQLELPSSYDATCLPQYGLTTLAKIEYEIRLGHAYDAIDDIRTSIHIYNVSSHEKQTQVSRTRQSTRAWGILSSLKSNTRECAKRYCLSYEALLALGLSKDSELKPIRDGDLWGKDMTSMTKQGDSKRKEPWYWTVGKPSGLSDDMWELECEFTLSCANLIIYVI